MTGEEIVTCEQAGITVYLPKPMTSGLLAKGRFGKQDFVYVAADDVYLCPAGEQLTYHYTNEEEGKTLRRYWTTACQVCALRASALQARNGEFHDWNTKPSLKLCRLGSIGTPLRCENAAKPWSIPWYDKVLDGGHALPDENAQERRHRNGPTRPGLHMKRVISILGVGGLMEAIRA